MSDPTGPLFKALKLDRDDPRAFTLTLNVGDEVTVQDALDGAALRRLREALRGEWHITIEPADDGLVFVAAGGIAYGFAATIAEAADKCREALER